MHETGPEAQSAEVTLGLIFEKLHPRLCGFIRKVEFDPKAKHDWEVQRVFSQQVKITLATLDAAKLRRCADAALVIRENLTTASAIRHSDAGLSGLFELLHPTSMERGVFSREPHQSDG